LQAMVERAQALADEIRILILMLLLEGDATVNDIVTRLGVKQPRVSTHLGILRKAELVSVEIIGRQRAYHADSALVEKMLDGLGGLPSVTPRRSPQANREVRHNTTLRQSRTCYDHIAGVTGVQLLDELLRRGWIEPGEGDEAKMPNYSLTAEGEQELELRGVDVAAARKARRRFAFGCTDWTERRVHLGGALGAAVLSALAAGGIIRRQRGTRAVVLRHSLEDWLNLLFDEKTVV